MEDNTVIVTGNTTSYRTAQALHQSALRQGILDDAGDLLMREGATALSMRRIAQLVGCSTTVLYTMFGSKQGLIDQLYLRGFEMLRQILEAVPESADRPRDHIVALCHAYRSFALTHATYYAIMFLKVIPEYTPPAASRQSGLESFQRLVQTIGACLSPYVPEDQLWQIARSLWATLHGHVSLELAGYFDYPGVSPQQLLEQALQALMHQLCPAPDTQP